MKIRILLMAAVCMFALTANAQKKATKKKKTAKTEQVVEAAKPDTVSAKDFSYALGMANVAGLKRYLAMQLGVDTVNNMMDFTNALREMFADPNNGRLKAKGAGYQIGGELMGALPRIDQQITEKPDSSVVSVEDFKRGVLAALTGQGQVLTLDSATAIVQKQMAYYNEVNMERKYGQWRKDNATWLEQNAKKDSVKSLPCGVQYKVPVEGSGIKPTATSTVKVNYEGKTIDGTVFDSSYKRKQPATFNCGQVIKGWTEALQQMPVGSTWEIYIPQELGYGARGAGQQIQPFSTLIFKVELIEVTEAAPAK